MEEQKAREVLGKKVQEIFHQHQKVLIKAGTGSGKTKIALELAAASGEYWYILVPRKPLFKTWGDEVDKWKFKEFKLKYGIGCYASAHHLPTPVPGKGLNLILDEAHRVTDRSWPHIERALGVNGKLICLSATVPYKKKDLLEQLGIFKEHTVTYTLDSAVEDNLVSDYRIQVIQFALDASKKQIEAGRKGNKFYVTEQDGYRYADQRARQAIYGQKQDVIKWAMLNRMRFIYNLPSKLEISQRILSQIPPDKKVIVFCGSIQQANAVCKHRFHSKTDETDYQDFCDGKIHQIAVVQSVSEGVNIPNIDYALLMQVQSEDLHTIQRIGRSLRKTDDPNKCSKIVILEATGTQDSKWVASAIQSFDPTKVDYISHSQLLNKGLTL